MTLMTVEEVAQVAHEVNRAYCEGLRDLTQRPWQDAPDWQKASAIAGVLAILENPDLTPEQSHENWCHHKLQEGWTYGPVKLEGAKEHPCLAPYDKLPREQQIKDQMFTALVKTLLKLQAVAPFED